MDKREERWQTLRQYEEQQRQARIEREKALAKQQEQQRQQIETQQAQREIARRETERQLAEQCWREQREAEVQQKNEERRYVTRLSSLARNLHTTDRQRYEALQEAAQVAREIEQVKRAGSPIENSFYEAWCIAYPAITLERQYRIGRYRVDFAHAATHTIIELDGHQFHSTRKDRNRDYQRQRELEEQGWHFLRFTGSEIVNDLDLCIETTWKRITAR